VIKFSLLLSPFWTPPLALVCSTPRLPSTHHRMREAFSLEVSVHGRDSFSSLCFPPCFFRRVCHAGKGPAGARLAATPRCGQQTATLGAGSRRQHDTCTCPASMPGSARGKWGRQVPRLAFETSAEQRAAAVGAPAKTGKEEEEEEEEEEGLWQSCSS